MTTSTTKPRTGVVSSAARLSPPKDAGAMRSRMAWQERAFEYYDALGEVWYAAQFYSRTLRKLELRISDITDADNPVTVDDPAINAILDRVQDPGGGGRSNLLGAYGRLRFLTGEAYLVVTLDTDGEEQWEMLSCDELRWQEKDGLYKRQRTPSAKVEIIREAADDAMMPEEGEGIAWRFWNRHPRYSGLADSPMRGVLDICEELLILTRAVRARGRSRSAGNGILFVPSNVSFTSLDGDAPSEDPETDVFLRMLTEAMMTPISDEGSASAVVPLILRVEDEMIEKFRHLPLLDPQMVYPETGLRVEAIHRLAIGLDMPPEILEGTGDANHWSGWQIGETEWKAHLQPIADELVGDMTAAYLRPSLRAIGVADPKRYAVTYDESRIVNHPDQSAAAKDAWDRLALSDEALLEALGFAESDAPEEEEWTRRVGVLLRNASLAVDGKLAPAPVAAAPGAPGEPDGSGDGEQQSEVDPGAPADNPADTTDPATSAALLQTASAMMVERCREAAGSRLRSRIRHTPQALDAVDGVHNRDVAAVLALRGLWNGYDAAELVGGTTECYAQLFGLWGMDAEGYARVGAEIERYAAETLLAEDPDRVPPVFR